MKSAANDCLGSTPWRDDLFITQVKNICANSAREYDFLHRLLLMSGRLTGGDLTLAAFLRWISDEVELARRREKLRRSFYQYADIV
ncbi:MAG: hypothetical protein LC725_12510 [Lentisphaerae bacterium]|nr:hypothetical protein [Lentisphaerota bacterium]